MIDNEKIAHDLAVAYVQTLATQLISPEYLKSSGNSYKTQAEALVGEYKKAFAKIMYQLRELG